MVTTSQTAPAAGTGAAPARSPGRRIRARRSRSGRTAPPAPSYEPMSVRGPPCIVLGLAVVILLGGVAAAALSSSANPTFTIRHVTLADGTTVHLVPAVDKLHAIVDNGEPPYGHHRVPGHPPRSRRSTASSTPTGTPPSSTARSPHESARPAPGRRGLPADADRGRLEGDLPGAGSPGRGGRHRGPGHPGQQRRLLLGAGVVVSPTTATGSTPYSVEVFETPDGN